eukprot:TRINITY_DN1589_c0_g1_i1.p1 TRINITY_DN1589_c0_g1~~TRINITY_DN1589_c0_g1_i1.p1  ORF type:complete len:266 (+),score=4.92 TRINITY_DN1589_c0_g1_i1:31-798(+)
MGVHSVVVGVIVVALCLVACSANALNATVPAELQGCYLPTTTRGVGVPISACPSGTEQSGLLCYPPCRNGYTGVGPVCWQQCPPGFVDVGALCQPRIISGDNSGCPWYDKCGMTFAKGCVKCPDGMNTDGCLCSTPGHTFAKNSYGRGAGVPMVCAAGLEYDAGLCYKPCVPGNYHGIGPVCWGSCPSFDPFSCGAICLADQGKCVGTVLSLSSQLLQLTANIVACATTDNCNIGNMTKEVEAIIKELGLSICPA